MLRVGIIGVGKRGTQFFNSLKNFKDVGISFVCDKKKDILQKIYNENTTLVVSDDFEKAINFVDCVVIATPTEIHFDIAKFFLNNRIPVLLEKPSTFMLEETLKLINIAESNNVHLQIGYSERYNPCFLEVKKRLRKDSKVFIEATRINQFSERTLSIDVIMDLMIHDIDIIINLLQNKPKNFFGFTSTICGNTFDFAKVILEFDNNITAECTANRLSSSTSRVLTIYESDVIYKLDFVEQSLTVFHKPNRSYQQQEGITQSASRLNDFVQIQTIKGEYRNLIVEQFKDFFRFLNSPDKYVHTNDILTHQTITQIREKLS